MSAPHHTLRLTEVADTRDVEGGRPVVSVTGKVAAILRAIGSGAEVSVSEVARRTGLPRPTTHRLLKELVHEQLVERTTAGRYLLRGVAQALMSAEQTSATANRNAVDRDEALHVRGLVCQTLDDLGKATGSQARFAVWSGTRISYVERSARTARGACTTGLVCLPPHATAVGKALLAHAPPDLLRRVVGQGLPSYTDLTITAVTDLESCLAAVRANELAVTWGELAHGRGAAATPVFGPGDVVVGALELGIDDLRELPGARACLLAAAPGLGRALATRPAALPTRDGAPDWRADPTSPQLTWEAGTSEEPGDRPPPPDTVAPVALHCNEDGSTGSPRPTPFDMIDEAHHGASPGRRCSCTTTADVGS